MKRQETLNWGQPGFPIPTVSGLWLTGSSGKGRGERGNSTG
jgi:hypothetical protein